MANPEKNQSQVQEMSFDQTAVETQTREEHRTHADGDLLVQIKNIYASWPAEKYNDVTFKQALNLYNRNTQTSNLVGESTLKEMRKEIEQISQEHGISAVTLFNFHYVIGYDPDLLKLFGDDPKLRLTTLIDSFKKCPNLDIKGHQERKALVMAAIKDGTAFHKKTSWREEAENTYTHYRTPFIQRETDSTPKTTPNQTVEETPNTEIIPFKKRTFSEKFKTIKDLKSEYSRGGKNNAEIPFLTAIKLFHPKYKEEESLQHTSDSIKSLERWFQSYLVDFGIDDIGQFDYELFSSFSNANSNIIDLFDDYDSEDKLGETTFRVIISELFGYHQKLQLFVSKFLLTIPLKDRPDIDKTKDFVKRCKIGFDFDVNNQAQEKRIIEIYADFINGIPEQSTPKQPILTQLPQERFPQTKGHYLESKPATLSRQTTVTKQRFSLPEERKYKTPKGIEPLKPKQNIVTLDSKPIQIKNISEQSVFIPETLEVRILKWWTNPECKLKPIEQDVMTEIYSGTNLFEIAKKTGFTSKQIYSIYERACSRKLFIDSKYSR